MAAVTSSIVALGGLGLSAGQLYQKKQDEQNSSREATIAKNKLEAISATNKLSAVQSPNISKLAFERNARLQADSLKAISEMGPEAAGQATRIEQAVRESNLDASERQAQADYQRDLMVANQDQAIENDRVNRESGIAWGQLQGAQAANAEARNASRNAVVDLVGSAGNLISGIGEATSLDAKSTRGANKAQRDAKKQGAPTDQNVIKSNEQLLNDFNDGYWENLQGDLRFTG